MKDEEGIRMRAKPKTHFHLPHLVAKRSTFDSLQVVTHSREKAVQTVLNWGKKPETHLSKSPKGLLGTS